jgi:hypothetical protein
VAHELAHVFTHADKGILAYLPALLLRPGRLVADYLAGRRKRYFNPFQFLLLSAALATLLANKLHVFDDMAALNNLPASYTPAQLARAEQFYRIQTQYFNLWWVLLLPLNGLVVWVLYRRQRVNYAEAFFMSVVEASAASVFMVLLFGAAGLAHRSAAAASVVLAALVRLGYFIPIGRTALGLRWPAAVGKALLVLLLSILLNSALTRAVFALFMALG